MGTCYVWQGVNVNGLHIRYARCVSDSDSPGWVKGSAPTGYSVPALNGQVAPNASDFYVTPGTIIYCSTSAEYTSAIGGKNTRGSCSTCLDESSTPPKVKKYDCINSSCISSLQYNTPGFFASLAECETACGTGCSGQCISNDEWNKIQSLANQLKNKNCK